MRTLVATLAIAMLAAVALSQGGDAPDTPADRGYAIGYDLGAQTVATLNADGVTFDAAKLLEGFTDALRGSDPKLSQAEMRAIRAKIEREVAGRIADERMKDDPVFRALAEYNRQKSMAFLDDFGGIRLPSGVRYEIVSAGAGEAPALTDTVAISFTATLIDGTVVANGSSEEVLVGGVIEGGREVLTQMKPGARWRVALPPSLAFGVGGRIPDIGPNEALIVDLTLHAIK